jgi:putative ABC transport system permease protein
MTWIALKMLMGDRPKYIGLVAGVTFAALLIAQQLSICCGLLLRTTSTIQDIEDAGIWVMDQNVEFIDEAKPLTEDDLYRVQGVPGVAWAVRFYKGQGRLKVGDGLYQQVIVLGVDDQTLTGCPRTIVSG